MKSSIKDLANIVNIGNILKSYSDDELVIVFSAMGKVTNMLEDVVELYFQKNGDATTSLQKVKDFHFEILSALFDQDHLIFEDTNNLFVEIEWVLEEDSYNDYAYVYDQIVSVGEFLSTKIMSAYLNNIGFKNHYLDCLLYTSPSPRD